MTTPKRSSSQLDHDQWSTELTPLVLATSKASPDAAAGIVKELQKLLQKCRRSAKKNVSSWHEQQTRGHLVEALIKSNEARKTLAALKGLVDFNQGEALYWVDGLKSAIERASNVRVLSEENELQPKLAAVLHACESFLETLRAPDGHSALRMADAVQTDALCQACAVRPGATVGARLCWQCATGMESFLASLPARSLTKVRTCNKCRKNVTLLSEYFSFALPDGLRKANSRRRSAQRGEAQAGITYCRSCLQKARAFHEKQSA